MPSQLSLSTHSVEGACVVIIVSVASLSGHSSLLQIPSSTSVSKHVVSNEFTNVCKYLHHRDYEVAQCIFCFFV